MEKVPHELSQVERLSPSTPESPSTSPLAQLEQTWSEIQVGHQGSYSIERLKLLQEYCNRTSVTRALLVCLLTPVPTLLVAVLLECLPLRSPAEGWSANWMFWIRLSLTEFIVIGVGSWQLDLFVPGHKFSLCQQFSLTLAICLAQMGTFMLEAVVVGFPVPFMWQFATPTLGIYIPVLTRLIYGPSLFVKGSRLQQHFTNFQETVLMNLTVTGIFPFCRVLYNLLPPGYRGVVVIILPFWKFGARWFAVRMSRQVEDFIPELVAFSVDFFSSLFISVCMSTSGSFYLTALFMVIDLVHLLVKFRGVCSQERVLLRLFQDKEDSVIKPKEVSQKIDSVELITTLVGIIRDPNVTSLKRIRLRANPPHIISEQLSEFLQTLEASGKFSARNMSVNTTVSFSDTPSHRLSRWMFHCASVVPAHVVPTSAPGLTTGVHSFRDDSSGQLVLNGLQLLFYCEYMVLVEYIECVVPFVYLAYQSALEQLPNVVYYPGVGEWGMTAVTNLLVFAVLKVGPLVLVHVFLLRKFAFSPLHQLAFVLETQFYAVQTTLFTLMIFALHYQLAHLGRSTILLF
ncbi:hypothetical protein PF005_g11765 [Phytophthora fragariae]|uniref:Uncharacterized protein n=1 Tax=Phytophthora fragariae TaxID=53985 RepID=A0A6A3KT43_9STRA|nr:hypothetical protein PF011_g10558 [Phytophthora fragariae]KAE9110255.1 hypothetical protein PF010_g11228 [Phytophthora fragariae]KAE9209578.1 hypothetical protein PF005_g11765 [Phytophthora fragariae]KAE9229806.1 hypothetical protein PF002_g13201 [Phytophthora fragariae]